MKIIAAFNHKGGVGKTTFIYNAAKTLFCKGYNVLCVDGDTQCNLSMLLMGDDVYDTTSNIKTALEAPFRGMPKPIEPFECKVYDGIYLINGSIDLEMYNLTLGLSLNKVLSSTKNVVGAFNELIRLTAEKYNIDVVLVDMNPSISAVNQTLTMLSDYIVVPTNDTFLADMALGSFSGIMNNWNNWLIRSKEYFAEADYKISDTMPKLLSVVYEGKPSERLQNRAEELILINNLEEGGKVNTTNEAIEKIVKLL